jgi:glycosyltransferase involved in cell wall biosynthesis
MRASAVDSVRSAALLKTSNIIPIGHRAPAENAAHANRIARNCSVWPWHMFSSTGVIVPTDSISPIVLNGKFFSRGNDKFFLKVIRFGARTSSLLFAEKIAVRKRLDDLCTAHTTTVLMGENEAQQLLDLVVEAGLYALVEIKIRPDSLASGRTLRTTASDLRKRITNFLGYPGIIAYLLDCPIEPDALRSVGLEMARARLRRLVTAIRDVDPHKMIAVKHRASTLGLVLRDEDFVYASMPPLAPNELRSRVTSLHNIAEARPLVLEFGLIGSAQDELIACGFGLGAAGIVVHPSDSGDRLSAPFKNGSLSLKMLRASEVLPFLALNGACPPQPVLTPKVSVVVCAYNAERTMRRCLESLRRLDYSNFEAIVVDDGSCDATPQIAAEFPEFRLLRQPNKGLSAARNAGMQAALGELIAYTDSDCVVDPHWLTFMVRSMNEGGFDSCGGPNYPPHEEGWIEGCVAAAPGAPCHVLIGDDRAEHLAGCNMVFRKAALEEIGGFDSQFTAAGDDVDICWRLTEAGYLLGYCPSAFVWHFRRNTIKAYYAQQRGYGKAEAALYFKYPERFNLLGQIRWKGTIPGVARTMPGGGRLRVQWVRIGEQFQHLDEMPLSMLAVAPITAEWSLAAATLTLLSLLFGVTMWPAFAALLAGPLWAAHYALRAPLEKCHRGAASRLLISWLAYSGSMARTGARYWRRLVARKCALLDSGVRQKPTITWMQRSIRLSYWNSSYITREAMLENLRRLFRSHACPVVVDRGWNDFDLLIEANPWTRIQLRTAEEELGGLELKTNVAARLGLSTGACAGIGACFFLAATASLFGPSIAAIALWITAAGVGIGAISGVARGARLAYRAIEQCAAELNLVPLGKPAADASIRSVPAAADPEPPAEVQPAAR